MGMPVTERFGGQRARRARALALAGGSVLVASVALGLLVIGVDRTEIIATVLFVPVFAAALLGGAVLGWAAAGGATLVYLAARRPDFAAMGGASFAALGLTRGIAYAVAARVGLKAEALVEGLVQGNEWDDSPLVARGRAQSRERRRDRPRASRAAKVAAAEPTTAWPGQPAVVPPYDWPPAAPQLAPAWDRRAPVLAHVGAASPSNDAHDAAGPTWGPPEGEPFEVAGSGWGPPEGEPFEVAGSGWGPPDGPPHGPAGPQPTGSFAAAPPPARSWSAPRPPGASPAPWSDPHGTLAVPPHSANPASAQPKVDPETRLWTAQFLCDLIASSKANCDRSGRSFSLVLVQVPDEPLAHLPYRRQVTLLRELGHQFVAGGVVEHLVHVPDQSQHWFAVVLPDTNQPTAHLVERRLRTGIGGYLRSRGLPLGELDSASLTAPDDDAALGEIWEALIARGDPASEPAMAYDSNGY